MQKIDLMGRTFGRLTVTATADSTKNGDSRWECRCECGAVSVVSYGPLSDGRTRSCGCLRLENKGRPPLPDTPERCKKREYDRNRAAR